MNSMGVVMYSEDDVKEFFCELEKHKPSVPYIPIYPIPSKIEEYNYTLSYKSCARKE